jgi:hypothetical protein
LAIIRNAATLTRWAAFAPGSVMPTSLEQLDMSTQLRLSTEDPELHALMSGSAVAELELAALNGTLAAAPITPQERQAAANAEQVQAILERNQGNPYGADGYYQDPNDPNSAYIPKREANATDSFALEALDPQLAAQLKLQANPPQAAPGTLSAADAQWVQQEMARVASMNMIGGGQ